MADESLRIRSFTYGELRQIAVDFLAANHSAGGIPVPVEEIVEFHLQLDIVPIPGLRRNYDVDGFVSQDFRDISVDQDLQERRPADYRYTLAHELSHVLIHQDVIKQLKFDSVEEWKAMILAERSDEQSVYEGQAHDLGCLILVPPARLVEEFENDRRRINATGLAPERLGERGRKIVESDMAQRFNVPRFVITDRMNRDRLWPE